MKRFLILPQIIIMAFILIACGGTAEPTAALPTSDGASSEEDGGTRIETECAYAFPVPAADGYIVAVNGDMAEVLDHLGEPTSYFEAASCAFDGLDKTYTYSGFTITTRPQDDRDLVNAIQLTDDSVTTAEGVYIGSDMQSVIDTYGDQAAEGNTLSYTADGVTLNFVLQDDKVASIEYFASGS